MFGMLITEEMLMGIWDVLDMRTIMTEVDMINSCRQSDQKNDDVIFRNREVSKWVGKSKGKNSELYIIKDHINLGQCFVIYREQKTIDYV